MYDFTYHRAATLDEAIALLAGADDGQFMAGGQTLIPTLKQRLAQPSDVIDIAGIEALGGIRALGDRIEIGAAETHAAVAASADVQGAIPALAEVAGQIGDAQVRNMGTIGGSLANNDPTADYAAAVLGLGATVHTNRREIAADDFFVDLFETALDDGEIITKVSFPLAERSGYAKFPNPASRYAIVGVFVAITGPGVRVAVTGAGASGVFRQRSMEGALGADFTPDAIAGIAQSDDGLNSDIHASAEYRAHLVTVMAKRAVAAAH
jgi:carbon-monoxide dehydrogenase medium subunit